MKKVAAFLLTLSMLLCMVPSAAAAPLRPEAAAQKLYELGLFKGVGFHEDGTPNFDLDRRPTRYEGVTMLVRLLGKDAEALAGTWETPFTDVVAWAKPYVGYAYAHGLTSGTSATTFGGDAAITCAQYLTFLLRVLGYESGKDFQWDTAWEFTDQIGLTQGQFQPAGNENLKRSGVAAISAVALDFPMKGSSTTLLETIFPPEEEIDAPVSPAPADRVATDHDPILDTFEIPVGLGKPRYDQDEIQKMIDDDLSLDQVAQMIATYADLLQYLHMKGFGTVPGPVGDLKFNYQDHYQGSVNRTAKVVFQQNDGNCGGGSNLVNYILRGDYDSQGYVAETANVGGHIYNYFEEDGMYYFCDLTQFVHGGQWKTNYRTYVSADPQEFSDYYIHMSNSGNRKENSEKYLLLHYMYAYDGDHLPLVRDLEGPKTDLGVPFSHILPNTVENVTRVLYVEEGCPSVEFIDPIPQEFWPEEARG